MLVELGQITLLAALLCSLLLGVGPMIGAQRNHQVLMSLGPRTAVIQFALVLTAFVILTWAFISQDFSVDYVARNSNSQLPMQYRFSAVWGAHEGSLLLWSLILTGWTLAVALTSRNLPAQFRARVLAVLGIVSFGFLLFVIYTSNPFGRLLPPAADGLDLNPLLQDPGLIIHPPMLYMGYVGFSVSFAFAIAALLSGKVNREWVRWSRPWTHIAWAFLTLGIALGSWWAYYELGWGGWWFWDPVENASFMPWLVGTALIHSQAVMDKSGAFRNWTLLLAISAFSLSLLGTFLVRSGVLTSVHAFAADPTRGVFILIYLFVVVGGSLTLFALRAPRMIQGTSFAGYSRETMLLINNLILTVMAGTVLTGTLYPLLLDALDAGKISVGPPYFGTLFTILLIPLVVLLPLGFQSSWRQASLSSVLKKLQWPLVFALGIAVLTAVLSPESGMIGIAGTAGGAWLIASSAWNFRNRLKQSGHWLSFGESGMTLAHVGVGVFLVGVSLTGSISSENHLRMLPGDVFEMAGYQFEFGGTQVVSGPNYRADQGDFLVTKDGREVARLRPEKRRYMQSGNIMTEAAIDPGLTRDLYISLGEPLDLTETGERPWAVRIYHKPFIRWIWLGTLLMTAGGVLAAGDRRYRQSKTGNGDPER